MHLTTNREKLLRIVFWVTAYVSMFYSSYRYPFKINFSGTSPTYIDTPPLLQAGKYVILMIACLVIISVAQKFYLRQQKLLFVLFYVAIISYPVVQFAYDGDSKNLVFPFVAIIVLLISVSVKRVCVDDVYVYIKFLLYVSLIANFIELILFFLFDRLPALAYPNSLSVRFGSFLDDPNGFGALLFLLLGYEFSRRRLTNNRLVLVGVIASIFMTQSLTAIGFFLVLFIIWAFSNFLKTSLLVFLSGLYFLIVTLSSFDVADNALLNAVYQSKQASVRDHFVSFDGQGSSVWSWLVGRFEYLQYESWWASSATNYGLIWSAALMAVLLLFLIRLWIIRKTIDSMRARSVFWGIFLFSAYVVAGSANLSFLLVFPVNYVFLLFLTLFMLGKMDFSDA